MILLVIIALLVFVMFIRVRRGGIDTADILLGAMIGGFLFWFVYWLAQTVKK